MISPSKPPSTRFLCNCASICFFTFTLRPTDHSTSTMATYMVLNGRLAGNYGFGNAVAVVLFVISLAVALTYQRFVLRRDTEGALTEGKKR